MEQYLCQFYRKFFQNYTTQFDGRYFHRNKFRSELYKPTINIYWLTNDVHCHHDLIINSWSCFKLNLRIIKFSRWDDIQFNETTNFTISLRFWWILRNLIIWLFWPFASFFTRIILGFKKCYLGYIPRKSKIFYGLRLLINLNNWTIFIIC